jgi:hypothetical protein
MDQEEVIKVLERLKRDHAKTPEYKKLRQDLPKDWPL